MPTKEQKVKELIKRVRLTPEEIDAASIWGAETVAQAALNKVLNDSDLALIDRELLKDESLYEDSIIPLAEELEKK